MLSEEVIKKMAVGFDEDDSAIFQGQRRSMLGEEDVLWSEDFDMRSVRQLFQAHMAHQLACLRGHGEPPGQSPASMAPETLDACRAVWKHSVHSVRTSRTQYSVLNTLREMGYRCRSELPVGGGLFCVDVALKHPSGTRVVVEVGITPIIVTAGPTRHPSSAPLTLPGGWSSPFCKE